jgi:hypothetical protein
MGAALLPGADMGCPFGASADHDERFFLGDGQCLGAHVHYFPNQYC